MRVNTRYRSLLRFNLYTGSRSHKECSTRRTVAAINVSHALLRLISVTVFNFTHSPALSALLLTLSASRFHSPDFSLLVPAPFLFSVHLHGMTFPFLSDRNPLWTHSGQTLRHFFSQHYRPAMFSVLLSSSVSSLSLLPVVY